MGRYWDEIGSNILTAGTVQVLGFSARKVKSVAEPGFAEDISGTAGISLDLLAKLVNDDMQVFHLVAIIRSPNRL
jgi:hypothetical protein